jgi:hypothetical protein
VSSFTRTIVITTTRLVLSVFGQLSDSHRLLGNAGILIAPTHRTRFFLFLGSWTVATPLLYIPGFLFWGSSIFFGTLSHLIYLFGTFAMWMSGTAALTQALGGGLNCDGPHRGYPHCNQLNTLEAFGWITSCAPSPLCLYVPLITDFFSFAAVLLLYQILATIGIMMRNRINGNKMYGPLTVQV